MARVLTDNKYYSQIADVIREQNGTSNTYKPQQIVSALKDLFYEEVEGVPPISFNGIGENLLDYRIDGAVGGVGDRTKNLLQNTATSQTVNGVIFTVNGDGSVDYERISTAERDSDLYLIGTLNSTGVTELEPNTNYIFSGGANSKAYVRVVGFGISGGLDVVAANSTQITYNEGKIILRVRVTETGSGTFYPMIRLASVTDDTYEPYGYKVPVMVEGKNLAKNNYITISSSLSDLIVEKIGEFIHVSATNNTANPVPYVISKDNNFHAGTYDIVNNSDTMIAYDYRDENNNLIYNTVESNTVKSFIFPESVQRGLNIYKAISSGVHIDNYFQVMIVKHGDDTDTYEPYIEPTTTNIYLNSPIEENESISLSDTNTNIPTIRGTNILTVDTTVQPNNVYVKARKESSYETAMRERYEEAQAQLDALESE